MRSPISTDIAAIVMRSGVSIVYTSSAEASLRFLACGFRVRGCEAGSAEGRYSPVKLGQGYGLYNIIF